MRSGPGSEDLDHELQEVFGKATVLAALGERIKGERLVCRARHFTLVGVRSAQALLLTSLLSNQPPASDER